MYLKDYFISTSTINTFLRISSFLTNDIVDKIKKRLKKVRVFYNKWTGAHDDQVTFKVKMIIYKYKSNVK